MPEFDGPTCERCGVEPAATCECSTAARPNDPAWAHAEAIGRVWEAMELCQAHGLSWDDIRADAEANYMGCPICGGSGVRCCEFGADR